MCLGRARMSLVRDTGNSARLVLDMATQRVSLTLTDYDIKGKAILSRVSDGEAMDTSTA